MTMTSEEWAKRYDLSEEYRNYAWSAAWEEEAFAMRMGFKDAEEYHAATDEAFAESVREPVYGGEWDEMDERETSY